MKRPVIRYHPAVPDDILEIVSYLDQHSTVAGDRFRRAVRVTIHAFARRPMSAGRLEVAGSSHEYRKITVALFRNYLLIYRVLPEGIRVIGVVHGSRDMRRFLRGRE